MVQMEKVHRLALEGMATVWDHGRARPDGEQGFLGGEHVLLVGHFHDGLHMVVPLT